MLGLLLNFLAATPAYAAVFTVNNPDTSSPQYQAYQDFADSNNISSYYLSVEYDSDVVQYEFIDQDESLVSQFTVPFGEGTAELYFPGDQNEYQWVDGPVSLDAIASLTAKETSSDGPVRTSVETDSNAALVRRANRCGQFCSNNRSCRDASGCHKCSKILNVIHGRYYWQKHCR